MGESDRRIRRFSENFRKEKVRDLERGIISVGDLVQQYQVSHMSVRRWILKFSSMKEKKERLIVESQSDTIQLLELKKKVAELDQVTREYFKDTVNYRLGIRNSGRNLVRKLNPCLPTQGHYF